MVTPSISIRRKRRSIIQPQLIAMLDVCSMITIFLIAGTTFGTEGVEIPPLVLLATSLDKRVAATAAPQIIIASDGVSVPFLKRSLEIEIFATQRRSQERTRLIIREIQEALKAQPSAALDFAEKLNVVADKTVSYELLFNVVSFFRECGFKNMAFISKREAAK